jgi:two-component system chemotaxis response regulator CheB
MIRVLIVDDSAFVRAQLRTLLEADARFTVAGEARNGREGVERSAMLRPDLVIMDVEMQGMDGIEATRRIMATDPVPIVIHTSAAISAQRNVPFEALRAGALDILLKPPLYPLPAPEERELLGRLQMLAGIHVFRRPDRADIRRDTLASEAAGDGPLPRVLAIAASTGGPRILSELFRALPPMLPFPVLLVQHIGTAFVEGFAEWLQNYTAATVKLASDGEALLPNVCYLSPGDKHLALRSPFNVHLDAGPPLHACRPSGDILFQSVRSVCGARAVGVVLTGIGQDGAEGLRHLATAGAVTIAQDEESCVVFGMPRKAIELGAASFVGDVLAISGAIQRAFRLSS